MEDNIMKELILALPIIIPAAFVIWMLVKDEIDKNRIFRDYDVLVWDEQDCIYVVADKKTGKQYMLENSFKGFKFKESDVDWSDCKGYIKERIPGTNRYDTTLPSKKCTQ